jgi:hypothetical protein
MPSTRLEPAIPAIELPLTYAYDRTATGIVFKIMLHICIYIYVTQLYIYICVCVCVWCVYNDMYKIIRSKPELFRTK